MMIKIKKFCVAAFNLAAAAAGVALAVWLFSSVMYIRASGSEMLPVIEPGVIVMAKRVSSTDAVAVGDMVVYDAPYFDVNGGEKYFIRRVIGMYDDVLQVGSEQELLRGESDTVKRDNVLGKVIYYGKKGA